MGLKWKHYILIVFFQVKKGKIKDFKGGLYKSMGWALSALATGTSFH